MGDRQAGVLVTVVIINHNYGQFLRTCIESILAQSHLPVEIIAVDDGSTDGSADILTSYGDRIITVQQDNLGHVKAFNAGFAASRGDLVLFVDADDVLYPECLASVLSAWRPGLSKVQFRLDTIDAAGLDLNMPFPAYSSALDASEIRRRSIASGYYPWPVSTGNAYARDYLLSVMPVPHPRIWKAPDGYVNKLAPLFGDVETLPRRLGAYRVHGSNLWASSSKQVNLAGYTRNVRFDCDLHTKFAEVAASRGLQVGSYNDRLVPQWIEVRLLSFRLRREEHPIEDDTAGRLLWLGLRAAARADGLTPSGRLLWALWFLAVATAPKALLLRLVQLGRIQSSRALLARLVVRASRSSA
ncbi:glycosyltransferase family 2 protein [Lichenicoccus sp.]|uniref:glycosyltransferase family 2 protein n=1 Tax=Lichenicoccus sp. TaxID=2781899 RepID=UPI003D0AABAD